MAPYIAITMESESFHLSPVDMTSNSGPMSTYSNYPSNLNPLHPHQVPKLQPPS